LPFNCHCTKKMKKLLLLSLLLWLISVALMIFGILATIDIYHDYVGTSIVSAGMLNLGGDLPEWTSCRLEWLLFQIDWTVGLVFMLLISAILIRVTFWPASPYTGRRRSAP